MTALKVIDIAKAAEALAEATERHADAKSRCAVARADETAALNALNSAQKKLDELVAGLKKGAPGDSDWGRNTHRRTEVA